jgi:hypothetical protein
MKPLSKRRRSGDEQIEILVASKLFDAHLRSDAREHPDLGAPWCRDHVDCSWRSLAPHLTSRLSGWPGVVGGSFGPGLVELNRGFEPRLRIRPRVPACAGGYNDATRRIALGRRDELEPSPDGHLLDVDRGLALADQDLGMGRYVCDHESALARRRRWGRTRRGWRERGLLRAARE